MTWSLYIFLGLIMFLKSKVYILLFSFATTKSWETPGFHEISLLIISKNIFFIGFLIRRSYIMMERSQHKDDNKLGSFLLKSIFEIELTPHINRWIGRKFF